MKGVTNPSIGRVIAEVLARKSWSVASASESLAWRNICPPVPLSGLRSRVR